MFILQLFFKSEKKKSANWMPPLRRLASILFCSMTAEFFQIFDFQKKFLYTEKMKKNNLNSSLARSIVHTTTLYLLIWECIKSTSFFSVPKSYILCIQQTITTYLLLLLFGQPKKFVRIQVTRRTLLSTLSINK